LNQLQNRAGFPVAEEKLVHLGLISELTEDKKE
jgi:hypothetical protein